MANNSISKIKIQNTEYDLIASSIIGLATTHEPIDGLTLEQSKVEVGQTMAFMTLSTAQLVHSFNVKSDHSIFSKKTFNNKFFREEVNVLYNSIDILVLFFKIPTISILYL